jgi:SAM-dependent methyltransferase
MIIGSDEYSPTQTRRTLLLTDDTLVYYSAHSQVIAKRYEQADVGSLHEFLKTSFPNFCNLLELGGGSGRDASYMIEQGHDLTFSDASLHMVKQGIYFHPELKSLSTVCRLPSELPFRDKTFDGVIAVGVVMHLPVAGIIDSIFEINRVLKSRGKLFLSVPHSRDDMVSEFTDNQGRLMTVVNIEELFLVYYFDAFELEAKVQNADGLNRRGIEWISYCFLKK